MRHYDTRCMCRAGLIGHVKCGLIVTLPNVPPASCDLTGARKGDQQRWPFFELMCCCVAGVNSVQRKNEAHMCQDPWAIIAIHRSQRDQWARRYAQSVKSRAIATARGRAKKKRTFSSLTICLFVLYALAWRFHDRTAQNEKHWNSPMAHRALGRNLLFGTRNCKYS